jgi:hypothetical protein
MNEPNHQLPASFHEQLQICAGSIQTLYQIIANEFNELELKLICRQNHSSLNEHYQSSLLRFKTRK